MPALHHPSFQRNDFSTVLDGHCTYRNTGLLILRTLVQFYILPHTHVFRSSRVYVCTRLLRATADSAWLSKQLENGSSRPRAIEAASEVSTLIQTVGFKLIQDSVLQIAETPLEELH